MNVLASLQNKFYERYNIIHQPTFELVLISACAGNLAGTILIGYYFRKYHFYRVNDVVVNDIPEIGEILYEGENPKEHITLLKTPKTKRKSVYTKLFIADYLPITNSFPISKGPYYVNKSY
jgi:hypothetical protein